MLRFMNKSIWIIDKHYAEFALIRKFAVACNHSNEDIVQYTGIEELKQENTQPAIIFLNNDFEDHHTENDIAAFKLKYERVPIILLASDDTDITTRQVKQTGAQDYLIKTEITLPLFQKCVQYAIDRKQFLNTLQQSKDEYMYIFKHHPLPMWLYDTLDLRFIAVNDAAIYYYGYSEADFLSMTIKDIRPKEDLDALMKTVNRDYKSGFYDNNHWTHIKKNGEQLKVHIYSHNIDFEGKTCKMVTAVNINREFELMMKLHELGIDPASK